jgi:hypothetical protein
LRWDYTIDQAIKTTLLKNQEIGFLDLKSKTDKHLRRTISFETFNSHLKRMANQKIINKQDNGRGKTVLYSLSRIARRKEELNLLNSADEANLSFKRIYEKIFFYEAYHRPLILLRSTDDFRKLLSDLNISETELVERSHKWDTRRWMNENTGKPRCVEHYRYTLYFTNSLEGLRIRKVENWTIDLEIDQTWRDYYYECWLPGVSVKDFMSYDFWGLKPKLQDVIRSFSLLEKYGIIKKIMINGSKHEIRYTLVDERLRKLSYELESAHSMEWDYLQHKWLYSRLPNRPEFERLIMLLGKENAYGSLAKIKENRMMHGIRWKLMDRKTQKEHKKELEKQFQEKESKLEKKVDWIKKKYSMVLRDYEFLYDVIGLICPMVIDTWPYGNKLIIKPDVPKELDRIDVIKLEPVSHLVGITWKERLESPIKMKMKKSGRSLYQWYQEYMGEILRIESIWYFIIYYYYELIRSAELQKRLVDKVLETKGRNGRLSKDEFEQKLRYWGSVSTIQSYYDYLIDYTKDLMCTLAKMASSLINSRNNWCDTETFTVHRRFFLRAENIPYTPSEDYAQLIRNETDWYEIAINPQRDAHNRVDVQVRDDDGIVYPHPTFDDRFFIGKCKMDELIKELEGAYPELLSVDDNLWSMIDYIKQNSHIKMNDTQKLKFHDIISEVGIQLPDFLYIATGVQRFLERIYEIFANEGIARQPITV